MQEEALCAEEASGLHQAPHRFLGPLCEIRVWELPVMWSSEKQHGHPSRELAWVQNLLCEDSLGSIGLRGLGHARSEGAGTILSGFQQMHTGGCGGPGSGRQLWPSWVKLPEGPRGHPCLHSNGCAASSPLRGASPSPGAGSRPVCYLLLYTTLTVKSMEGALQAVLTEASQGQQRCSCLPMPPACGACTQLSGREASWSSQQGVSCESFTHAQSWGLGAPCQGGLRALSATLPSHGQRAPSSGTGQRVPGTLGALGCPVDPFPPHAPVWKGRHLCVLRRPRRVTQGLVLGQLGPDHHSLPWPQSPRRQAGPRVLLQSQQPRRLQPPNPVPAPTPPDRRPGATTPPRFLQLNSPHLFCFTSLGSGTFP